MYYHTFLSRWLIGWLLRCSWKSISNLYTCRNWLIGVLIHDQLISFMLTSFSDAYRWSAIAGSDVFLDEAFRWHATVRLKENRSAFLTASCNRLHSLSFPQLISSQNESWILKRVVTKNIFLSQNRFWESSRAALAARWSRKRERQSSKLGSHAEARWRRSLILSSHAFTW